MYDTIIIGAGMSGLAAGIRLAHYDRRVCILERHYTIGGLNSFYRLRGRDYDVGLHAVTNFTPKGTRKGPLARLLRQLRFRWEDFAMAPQLGSSIRFPDTVLRFGNDMELLRSEIAREFPGSEVAFDQLLHRIVEYDDLDQTLYEQSARRIVSEIIHEPLLVEMLFCPLMWYGNAREDDMDFGQFCIMFRSIFLEGLARPYAGVRLILRQLIRRFRELGGELKLRHGVSRIEVQDGRAVGVVLDDGSSIEARNILSSAGWVETMRLCADACPDNMPQRPAGRLSFIESMAELNCQPRQIGHEETIVFYNDHSKFCWRKAEDFCDLRTGVICSPNNFAYGQFPDDPQSLPEGVIRVTSLANFDRWTSLATEAYPLEKLRWFDRAVASAVRFVPDFRRQIIDTDMFTPQTIRRFTWHDNGAVYGAPQKQLDGTTPIPHLYVCGTDQGFVGIVGTIMSGISIANQHLLPQGGPT